MSDRVFNRREFLLILLTIVLVMISCTLPTGQTASPAEPAVTVLIYTALVQVTSAPVVTEAPPIATDQTQVATEVIQSTPEPQTETPSAQLIAHAKTPAEPVGDIKSIKDHTSQLTAADLRAPDGDYFASNRYERPFDGSMNYWPFIDIAQADINLRADSEWVYAMIRLVDSPKNYPGHNPVYGIEIDTHRRGRGEYLILTTFPEGVEWSTNGVKVYRDTNEDVGSIRPILSDAPNNGNGYNSTIFNAAEGDDPDLAWSRLSQGNERFIEIAFKKQLLGPEQAFLWGAWADDAIQKPEWMDYNDHFTYEEAGSSIREQFYYPLKQLYGIDNTCRAAFGFAARGDEWGLCPTYKPTAIPEQPQPGPSTPTWVVVQTPPIIK